MLYISNREANIYERGAFTLNRNYVAQEYDAALSNQKVQVIIEEIKKE